jgi:hypothetical protein
MRCYVISCGKRAPALAQHDMLNSDSFGSRPSYDLDAMRHS